MYRGIAPIRLNSIFYHTTSLYIFWNLISRCSFPIGFPFFPSFVSILFPQKQCCFLFYSKLRWNWFFFFLTRFDKSKKMFFFFFFFLIWFFKTMKFFENWNDLIIRIQQSIQKDCSEENFLFLLCISILIFSFLLITMYSLLDLLYDFIVYLLYLIIIFYKLANYK